MPLRVALILSLFVCGALHAESRRALLVGINDYTASTSARDWPSLRGAVNDVHALREMLVLLYGFEERDIVVLTDRAATRDAVLQAIDEQLVKPARKGDVLFFYYAGHGSRVANSLSREPDKMDESLVPADGRDIRDKELRVRFNRILDRGARLTILLDACHSASGVRGLVTGARPRGVAPDLRDVRDATHGPRPEDRGALVMAAAQDLESAWETRDAEGRMHGAFSWAFLRALRDAAAGEPALDTFLRAQARLRGERPDQTPVLAGNAEVRRSPFLGVRRDRQGERTVVAVEKIQRDGRIVLQGGWANGLSVGSTLRANATRLVVTALLGLGRSEARLVSGPAVTAGALLESAGWAAPPGRPLRVWMPRGANDERVARKLAQAAARRRIRWIFDPTESTPSHLLRRSGNAWELLGPHTRETLANDDAAVAAIEKLPAGASLFVQFAAPAVALGDDIEAAARPDDADYLLVTRYRAGRFEHAWLRPFATTADRRRSALPPRTAWVSAAAPLRDTLLRLRKIHAWQTLETPPDARVPYRLALRRGSDGALVNEPAVTGGETYELLLRAPTPLPARVPPRYYYAFVIDSHGKSILVYPAGGSGSVENRFPLTTPAAEIALAQSFAVAAPYGVDTFFLLSTDEPLPNPWVLEWDGVRAATAALATPTWTLERVVFESIPPQKRRRGV